MTDPLAVYDVRNTAFTSLSPDEHAALVTWIRAQDIDPEETLRIEIYDGSPGFVRVTQVVRNEAGHKTVDLELNQLKRGEPFDVPIQSLPPVGPWKGGDAP
ncbi:hypothetical protein BJF79_13585 [Actinomadura sp. CNU-125]|uniref:hypothetical protein n=1 Tax=Actinomadura sp. CNU-125 TaxID=1904961 RepID=UPI00095AE7E1|nr:hypothetical protein [Actinomadura sp. CNU-125]OLT24369.1 hypothetical protein BJF79_13585 [Actinomadura sp. CNU-125]